MDSSIFRPVMYKTLLALWVFLLDTCRNTRLRHCRFHQEEGLNQRNASEQHLEDLSGPRVQNSDSSVFGGDGQPAAVAIEADGEEQGLGRVAVLDGRQDHSGRTSDHRLGPGHVPEEDLDQETNSGMFNIWRWSWFTS